MESIPIRARVKNGNHYRCGKESRCSRKTVSRVLNKSPMANAETRKAVLKTIHELKYTQNILARSMR